MKCAGAMGKTASSGMMNQKVGAVGKPFLGSREGAKAAPRGKALGAAQENDGTRSGDADRVQRRLVIVVVHEAKLGGRWPHGASVSLGACACWTRDRRTAMIYRI